MNSDAETIVIGAGVIGLSIALAMSRRGRRVLVLERRERAGAEISQRSSEVVHAGLYYPPGSLKARLCRDGSRLIFAFAHAHGISTRTYGKLLVATSAAETDQLEGIARSAASNGVTDLRRLTPRDIRSAEPELAVAAALYSPTTGVIDSAAFISALEGHALSLGGEIIYNATVTGLTHQAGEPFVVEVASGGTMSQLRADELVIAAGLGSSALGSMIQGRNGYTAPQTHFAKGHYFALTEKSPFHHLVYPVPGGGGLGIHLTMDVSGAARFGPDIEWRDSLSYAFDDEDGQRRKTFESAIRRYWPGLPSDVLQPASTGIRPKITRQGEAPADFAIHGREQHGIPNLVALYGIESPGLTSSLAIGEHVAAMMTGN